MLMKAAKTTTRSLPTPMSRLPPRRFNAFAEFRKIRLQDAGTRNRGWPVRKLELRSSDGRLLDDGDIHFRDAK
jgi:hypothetical protein